MNRRLLYGLLIIALCVIVFIFTRGDVSINLLVTRIRPPTSIALLTFMGLGVVVGLLLK